MNDKNQNSDADVRANHATVPTHNTTTNRGATTAASHHTLGNIIGGSRGDEHISRGNKGRIRFSQNCNRQVWDKFNLTIGFNPKTVKDTNP